MTFDGIREIFKTLNDHQVDYLVVGGLAVIAHGYIRLTVDIDLVIDLEESNIRKTLTALSELGYKPRVPVDIFDFANPDKREDWRSSKNMVVFQLDSDQFPGNPIDLFVSNPFDFSVELKRAPRYAIDEEVVVPIVSINALIDMKKTAMRDKDLLDITNLEKIKIDRSDHEQG